MSTAEDDAKVRNVVKKALDAPFRALLGTSNAKGAASIAANGLSADRLRRLMTQLGADKLDEIRRGTPSAGGTLVVSREATASMLGHAVNALHEAVRSENTEGMKPSDTASAKLLAQARKSAAVTFAECVETRTAQLLTRKDKWLTESSGILAESLVPSTDAVFSALREAASEWNPKGSKTPRMIMLDAVMRDLSGSNVTDKVKSAARKLAEMLVTEALRTRTKGRVTTEEIGPTASLVAEALCPSNRNDAAVRMFQEAAGLGNYSNKKLNTDDVLQRGADRIEADGSNGTLMEKAEKCVRGLAESCVCTTLVQLMAGMVVQSEISKLAKILAKESIVKAGAPYEALRLLREGTLDGDTLLTSAATEVVRNEKGDKELDRDLRAQVRFLAEKCMEGSGVPSDAASTIMQTQDLKNEGVMLDFLTRGAQASLVRKAVADRMLLVTERVDNLENELSADSLLNMVYERFEGNYLAAFSGGLFNWITRRVLPIADIITDVLVAVTLYNQWQDEDDNRARTFFFVTLFFIALAQVILAICVALAKARDDVRLRSIRERQSVEESFFKVPSCFTFVTDLISPIISMVFLVPFLFVADVFLALFVPPGEELATPQVAAYEQLKRVVEGIFEALPQACVQLAMMIVGVTPFKAQVLLSLIISLLQANSLINYISTVGDAYRSQFSSVLLQLAELDSYRDLLPPHVPYSMLLRLRGQVDFRNASCAFGDMTAKEFTQSLIGNQTLKAAHFHSWQLGGETAIGVTMRALARDEAMRTISFSEDERGLQDWVHNVDVASNVAVSARGPPKAPIYLCDSFTPYLEKITKALEEEKDTEKLEAWNKVYPGPKKGLSGEESKEVWKDIVDKLTQRGWSDDWEKAHDKATEWADLVEKLVVESAIVLTDTTKSVNLKVARTTFAYNLKKMRKSKVKETKFKRSGNTIYYCESSYIQAVNVYINKITSDLEDDEDPEKLEAWKKVLGSFDKKQQNFGAESKEYWKGIVQKLTKNGWTKDWEKAHDNASEINDLVKKLVHDDGIVLTNTSRSAILKLAQGKFKQAVKDMRRTVTSMIKPRYCDQLNKVVRALSSHVTKLHLSDLDSIQFKGFLDAVTELESGYPGLRSLVLEAQHTAYKVDELPHGLNGKRGAIVRKDPNPPKVSVTNKPSVLKTVQHFVQATPRLTVLELAGINLDSEVISAFSSYKHLESLTLRSLPLNEGQILKCCQELTKRARTLSLLDVQLEKKSEGALNAVEGLTSRLLEVTGHEASTGNAWPNVQLGCKVFVLTLRDGGSVGSDETAAALADSLSSAFTSGQEFGPRLILIGQHGPKSEVKDADTVIKKIRAAGKSLRKRLQAVMLFLCGLIGNTALWDKISDSLFPKQTDFPLLKLQNARLRTTDGATLCAITEMKKSVRRGDRWRFVSLHGTPANVSGDIANAICSHIRAKPPKDIEVPGKNNQAPTKFTPGVSLLLCGNSHTSNLAKILDGLLLDERVKMCRIALRRNAFTRNFYVELGSSLRKLSDKISAQPSMLASVFSCVKSGDTVKKTHKPELIDLAENMMDFQEVSTLFGAGVPIRVADINNVKVDDVVKKGSKVSIYPNNKFVDVNVELISNSRVIADPGMAGRFFSVPYAKVETSNSGHSAWTAAGLGPEVPKDELLSNIKKDHEEAYRIRDNLLRLVQSDADIADNVATFGGAKILGLVEPWPVFVTAPVVDVLAAHANACKDFVPDEVVPNCCVVPLTFPPIDGGKSKALEEALGKDAYVPLVSLVGAVTRRYKPLTTGGAKEDVKDKRKTAREDKLLHFGHLQSASDVKHAEVVYDDDEHVQAGGMPLGVVGASVLLGGLTVRLARQLDKTLQWSALTTIQVTDALLGDEFARRLTTELLCKPGCMVESVDLSGYNALSTSGMLPLIYGSGSATSLVLSADSGYVNDGHPLAQEGGKLRNTFNRDARPPSGAVDIYNLTSMPSVTKLETLELVGTDIAGQNIVWLGKMVKSSKSLKSLNVSRQPSADKKTNKSPKGEGKAHERNEVSVDSIRTFCKDLSQTTSLTTLIARDQNLDDEACALIALGGHAAPLTTIDLCRNQITQVGACCLMEGFQNSIVKLSLSGNKIKLYQLHRLLMRANKTNEELEDFTYEADQLFPEEAVEGAAEGTSVIDKQMYDLPALAEMRYSHEQVYNELVNPLTADQEPFKFSDWEKRWIKKRFKKTGGPLGYKKTAWFLAVDIMSCMPPRGENTPFASLDELDLRAQKATLDDGDEDYVVESKFCRNTPEGTEQEQRSIMGMPIRALVGTTMAINKTHTLTYNMKNYSPNQIAVVKPK
eukprot:CAMPEP_0183794440 /NCGR_PEP_ID=MMETSP0803_2-20130417/3833_1 /TAXON_ID=195967 /ORGANISM="Crustomastix stigmata, Strain CCMP3273" /LENGTH=2309 /DNA_ID=CAMNT_0026038843 /DNA_START=83 /DNA_END=7012 /DNA_ORIENTATION=-